MPRLNEEQLEAFRERQRLKAAQAEAAELAAQNPRCLEVDSETIQRRNEIAAQLLSYYKFLVSMYLPEEVLKIPRKEGWPVVNAERFAFLNKTDAVIDLYKHIPYIRQSIDEEFHIAHGVVMLDYSGSEFEYQHIRHQSGHMEPPQFYEQMDGEPTWSPNLDDPQHIAVLAIPRRSTDHYLLLDTRDGKAAVVTPRDCQDSVSAWEYGSMKEYLDEHMSDFGALETIPISPTDIINPYRTYYEDHDVVGMKEAFLKHGWGSANYDKEGCMAEIGQIVEAFWVRGKARQAEWERARREAAESASTE